MPIQNQCPIRYMKRAACVTLAAIVLGFGAEAKAENYWPKPSMKAVKTDTKPVIDGKLEECWSLAEVVSGFTEYKTERNAIEQTLVRVLYDNENLYIAFECLEPDPNKIQAMTRKYDRWLSGDDAVVVYIDTFHDKRSSYVFATNTLGTRYDAHSGVFSSYRTWKTDVAWNCDWQAACTIEKDRWFAEMAIPIGSMHFNRKDAVTFGINFERIERDGEEESSWSYHNRQPQSPKSFGELTNLDLAQVKVPMKPQFETYVSGTTDLKTRKNEFSTGLDVSARLSPEWISAFTINPDYGQVEADADTIELRDTERFLQERRTFFTEGTELFQTPLDIYYSRRFSSIDLGAKITGQGKDWALGFIDVEGEISRDDEVHEGNYQVGRLIRYLGENSHIGAMWTAAMREDGRNLVGGPDLRMYLNSDTYFTGQLLWLKDNKGIETDGEIDHQAYGLYSNITGGTKPIQWSLSYRDITKGFQPDLGYIPRRDIRGPSGRLGYTKDIEHGPIKRIYSRLSYSNYENHNGEKTVEDLDGMLTIRFRNKLELWLSGSDEYHAPYQNRHKGIWVGHNSRIDKWDSIMVGYQKGVFENVPYDEFSLEKTMKLTDRLTTKIDANLRETHPEGGDEKIWLMRWVTEYNFLSEGRIKFTAEETSEDRHNFTLLFYWPFKKNIDFYMVFNDFKTGANEPTQRGIFSKLVYRF